MSNLVLAITTIGDLLLNQKITNGVEPNDAKLNIPIYQRPYKWTARNAIQLLDDIIEAMNGNKEKYRVGTLILHEQEEGVFDIVDGQQRVITFSLLLRALGEENISFLQRKVYSNEHNCRNIPNNYQALCRRLGKNAEGTNDDQTKERERLKDYIENRCELIVVITTDVSEAFQFFDSQNARGKALYPHDLLKAYHLREMTDVSEEETERIVKGWEQVSQSNLANLFGNYLYRIKQWVNGDRADILNEHSIQMFKGITRYAKTPYAQYFKAAYCYADMVNSSAMPFVSGIRDINAFQLNTPIIAGKPFFEYTRHYYSILKDIQDNSKYEGFYINGNEMVKTLDSFFNRGTGNGIARLLFDTSVLLYVDRFCPESYPSKEDLAQFEQFVVYAFVWAYSLRAQYRNLGWLSAQNYIMGESGRLGIVNSFNMYKLIVQQETPASLLSALADQLCPLSVAEVNDGRVLENSSTGRKIDDEEDGVYCSYLHFFKQNGFYK